MTDSYGYCAQNEDGQWVYNSYDCIYQIGVTVSDIVAGIKDNLLDDEANIINKITFVQGEIKELITNEGNKTRDKIQLVEDNVLLNLKPLLSTITTSVDNISTNIADNLDEIVLSIDDLLMAIPQDVYANLTREGDGIVDLIKTIVDEQAGLIGIAIAATQSQIQTFQLDLALKLEDKFSDFAVVMQEMLDETFNETTIANMFITALNTR